MKLNYHAVGARIARRRKSLQLTQSKVAELCDISDQYLSNIERSTSIPSVEVIMRLAHALDTTPDEFLAGTYRKKGEEWRSTAERLRGLTPGQLSLVEHFLDWVTEQKL